MLSYISLPAPLEFIDRGNPLQIIPPAGTGIRPSVKEVRHPDEQQTGIDAGVG